MSIRVVMLGDIVGRSGRLAVMQQIPAIRRQYEPHLIIANAENAANGTGLMPEHYKKLCESGVDAMTLGDHVYKKTQITSILEREANIIRPANLPPAAVGRRWMSLRAGDVNVYVFTVLGRLFMNLPADDPFATADRILDELPEKNALVIVEVHAEATSEKQALAWHLSGRVTAVIGTHTHVPTADARVLQPHNIGDLGKRRLVGGGTAYITDIGMCGPQESVLGRQIDRVLKHMTSAMPAPFDVAEGDPRVCGVMVEMDTTTRRAVRIERIELKADPGAPPFMG